MKLSHISDSELELMKIIWEQGGSAWYSEIMEALSRQGCPWQKNTVITLLSRLTEKGLLKPDKVGRRNRYIAACSEEDYRAWQTKGFLDKVYQGSAKGLVSALIRQDMLSAKEYEELKAFWEEEKKKR